MRRGTEITEQEAKALIAQGIAQWFDFQNPPQGGFFEADEDGRKDSILVITNEGYFVRAREDLVKSDDKLLVGFVEDGDKPPNFEDVFEVREF